MPAKCLLGQPCGQTHMRCFSWCLTVFKLDIQVSGLKVVESTALYTDIQSNNLRALFIMFIMMITHQGPWFMRHAAGVLAVQPWHSQGRLLLVSPHEWSKLSDDHLPCPIRAWRVITRQLGPLTVTPLAGYPEHPGTRLVGEDTPLTIPPSAAAVDFQPHPHPLQVWPILDPVVCALIKSTIEPLLDDMKPPFIAAMGFQKLTLGELPVELEGIRVVGGEPEGERLDMHLTLLPVAQRVHRLCGNCCWRGPRGNSCVHIGANKV